MTALWPTILPLDAIAVGGNARPMDVLETRALVGMDPVKAAWESARISTECWTWWEDFTPGAIFGAIEPSILGHRATIWMMTTPLVDQHRMKFLRHSRKIMGDFRARYGELETEVDARHTACLRWLEWLGFNIPPARVYGAARVPFHHVHIGA